MKGEISLEQQISGSNKAFETIKEYTIETSDLEILTQTIDSLLRRIRYMETEIKHLELTLKMLAKK